MRLKCKKGITIIELLIYMALLSIVLITMTDLFVATFSTKLESESNFRIEEDGKFILKRLTYDIQRSDSIGTPATPGATSASLVTTINSINNTYSLSSNNLILQNNLGTNQINGSDTNITSLTFKRLGNISGKNAIKIDFTITSIIERKGSHDFQTFTTVVGLR